MKNTNWKWSIHPFICFTTKSSCAFLWPVVHPPIKLGRTASAFCVIILIDKQTHISMNSFDNHYVSFMGIKKNLCPIWSCMHENEKLQQASITLLAPNLCVQSKLTLWPPAVTTQSTDVYKESLFIWRIYNTASKIWNFLSLNAYESQGVNNTNHYCVFRGHSIWF